MSITRALTWDNDFEQQFIAINPVGDEVLLYQTHHDDINMVDNGLIKLQSRQGFDNIECMSYSLCNKGLISIGQLNGNICIFDINTPNSSILKLRPKQSRPCNAVSFNNNNLVAGGFDKGRQDNSLQIWNIEHYSKLSSNDHIKRPHVSYIPNEAVLSTEFYPDQQFNLICGSYKYLREIDLRLDQPVFQIATKCTSGLSIDPFQSHYFSSFSEDGSLSIWDRRKLITNKSHNNFSSESPVLQFNKLLDSARSKNNSRCLRYSTIRKGEFSSIFNGEIIRRWQTGTVPSTSSTNTADSLADQPNDNNSTTTNDYTAKNIISSLKLQSNQLYKPHENSLFVSLVLDVKPEFSRIISFDYSPDSMSSTSTNFVCMRQSGSVFRMPVVECIESLDFNSFNEFVMVGPEGAKTKFSNDINNFKNLKQNNLLNRINDFSLSNNDLSRLAKNDYELESLIGKNRRNIKTLNEIDDEDEDEDEEEEDEEDDDNEKFDSIEGDEEELSQSSPINNLLDASQVLDYDICSTIRKRATLGYGHDCEKNIKVLESIDNMDNQLSLRNTWKWLSLAKKSLDKGTMISQGIDLGFLGVLGIWNGIEKLTNPNRFSKDIETLSDSFFSNTIKSIVSSKGKKAAAINIPSNSERKSQRKLCLIVSGWYFSDEEFDERLNILINLGFIEKAAGWAVFHGNVNKAIEILASSKKSRLRLMATAVAGYLAYKNSNINSPWKDQCRKMASELDDPYLRAIFAFIADNDWWDVLDEHSLPLRERLGVALRFLSDKDLTVYLNRIGDTVVAKGELEGLILTGITAKGIDLIQGYVDRTSDVQTASLIASYGSPRYLVDNRIDHWIDCYRNLLNSWSMFNIRAKFDVNRTKLSKNRNGALTLKPIPKQVYLQCPKCNKNISKRSTTNNHAINNDKNDININKIDHNNDKKDNNNDGDHKDYNHNDNNNINTNNDDDNNPTTTNTTNNNNLIIKQFNKMSTANSRQDLKNCINCGSQLPRCSICLLSFGSAVPLDKTEKFDTNGSGYGNVNRSTNNVGTIIENKFREWFSFCLNCNHGCHAFHAEEWFSKHYVCPVPDCNCRCNSL